jgi:hypothetical protein
MSRDKIPDKWIRTIDFLESHPYDVCKKGHINSSFREKDLGRIMPDGSIEIQYSLNLDKLSKQLELRCLLKNSARTYHEKNFKEAKEKLIEKFNYFIGLLRE